MNSLESLTAGLLSVVPTPVGAPSPTSAGDPFWQRFLTSAGFGGLMALIAAVIAARIAARQLRQAKSQQVNERWWNTLTWIYDRAVVEKDTRSALPHHVTIAMLNQLEQGSRAKPEDALQQGAIKSVLSVFDTTSESNSPSLAEVPGPASIHVTDPTAAALFDELRERLSSDEERYLRAAGVIITKEFIALGAEVTEVSHGEHGTRAIVTRQDREILVNIRYFEGQALNVSVFQSIERLQKEITARHTAIGGLLVVNTPVRRAAVDPFIAAKQGLNIRVVRWASQADDPALHAALHDLLPSDRTAPDTTEPTAS